MSMMRRGFCPWALVAAQVTIVCPALAQVGAGTLTGKVVDAASKEAVADVVVTVTSPSLQGEQIAVTDASGSYRIPNLPPGDYQVRMEKESYKPYARQSVGLRADSTIKIDAQLLPESLKAETVEIVAQAPTVDVGSANVGSTLNKEFLRRVPVMIPTAKGAASKSIESVAIAAPGAQSDQYGTSVAGSSSVENAYVIDGVSANSAATGALSTPFSSEFVSEVNVITGGYMPEYGRATGGVVNAVTKSGGNEFHGGAWGELTPGFLEGTRKTVYTDTVTAARVKLNSIWNVGFDVGGPIQKDKLWFYVGFQAASTSYDMNRLIGRVRLENGQELRYTDGDQKDFWQVEYLPETAANQYKAKSLDYQVFGKLTYTVNPSNRISLSLFANPYTSGGEKNVFGMIQESGLPEWGATGGSSFSALARKRTGTAINPTLNWTSDFAGKKVLLDTTLGWRYQTQNVLPWDGSAIGSDQGLASIAGFRARRGSVIDAALADPDMDAALTAAGIDRANWCDPTIIPAGQDSKGYRCNLRNYLNGGPFGIINQRVLNRYQAKSVLSWFPEGLGHHVVKAGVDFEYLTYGSTRGWAGGHSLDRVNPGEDPFDFRIFSFLRGPDDVVVASKLETQTKSLIAGGFLQDSWNIMDKVSLNAGLRYDAQWMMTTDGAIALSLPNQWSPRIGAIYDPTQSGRAKIFGNYAIFYESVPLNLADRTLEGESGVGFNAYKCDPNTDAGRKECNSSTAQVTNGGINPSRKMAVTGGGGSIAIDPDIKPQSSSELVFGGEYDVGLNLRSSVTYTKRWLNRIIEDMSRDEAASYFLGNPGFGIARDFPVAVRDYDALTVGLSRMFRDNWQASASYTLATLKGNYDGLFRPTSGQLDPNGGSDFDLMSLLANRTGWLSADRRHQIRVSGSYDIPLPNQQKLGLGGTFVGSSGAPYSYLGRHAIYGPGEAFLSERGSAGRLPWNFSTDVQASYGIKVWGDKMIDFTVVCMNLLNFQTETAVDQNYTDVPVTNVKETTVKPEDFTQITKANGTPFTSADVNRVHGKPTAFQPPRYFKFGIRASF